MRRRIRRIVRSWAASIVQRSVGRNVRRSLIKSLERRWSRLLSCGIEMRSEELRSGVLIRVVHAHHWVEIHRKSKRKNVWKRLSFWSSKIRLYHYSALISITIFWKPQAAFSLYWKLKKLPHNMWKWWCRKPPNLGYPCASQVQWHWYFLSVFSWIRSLIEKFDFRISSLNFLNLLNSEFESEFRWLWLSVVVVDRRPRLWSLGGGERAAVGSAPTLRLDHPRRSLAPHPLFRGSRLSKDEKG